MDPQQPPPHHQYAPPPPQNPNPNLQQQQQYYYPNPNPNLNPNLQQQQQQQQYYYPNPNPSTEAAAVAAVPYEAHCGYSVDPTASAVASVGAGVEPYYYYQGYGWDPSQYYGVDPNSRSQVQPIPSNGLNSTALPRALPSQWGAKSSYRRGSKKGFRMTKVVQHVHCGVCKIECNTQEVLNAHKQGKKHKKNLQKLQESITPKSQRAQTTTNGAEKKGTKIVEGGARPSEIARVYCEVCKIYCDTQAVLNIHEQGKKHKKFFQKLQYSVTPKSQNEQLTTNSEDMKEAEANKVVQPVHCAACNIFCDTQEVLNIHNVGKKHKKNLWKLQNSIISIPVNALGSKRIKRKVVTEEELETKKRKILSGGAAPSEVKVCSICNVVVNSQMVYNTHIAGSRHIAMVKKQQEAAIVEGEKSADSESLAAQNLASNG